MLFYGTLINSIAIVCMITKFIMTVTDANKIISYEIVLDQYFFEHEPS